jgi:hydroxymethylpyrimidine/phosphomethylpyrimidine kinase
MPPLTLTIAGFDPSAGAGLAADLKAFAALGVYGQAACTALTLQNENEFQSPGWVEAEKILEQLEILFRAREIKFVKIGLIENSNTLEKVLDFLQQKSPDAFILWDPIIKASAGFTFHANAEPWKKLLPRVSLVTPNAPEAQFLDVLHGHPHTPVLLKGGHAARSHESTDTLFSGGAQYHFTTPRVATERHGSGCTLSALILANLALGQTLPEACENAKNKMQEFFENGDGKLGFIGQATIFSR